MNRNKGALVVDVAYWAIAIVFWTLIIYAIRHPELYRSSWAVPTMLTLVVVSVVLPQIRARLRRR